MRRGLLLLSMSPVVIAALVVACGPEMVSSTSRHKADRLQFLGGKGNSIEDATIIAGARDQKEGVEAEYAFIAREHGKKDRDWRVVGQSASREGDKVYDIVEIELLPTNQSHYHYFDISQCTWKPKVSKDSPPAQ